MGARRQAKSGPGPPPVQQLVQHLQTYEQAPTHSSHRPLYTLWRGLFEKRSECLNR